jgi:hypothetical protein
MNIYTEDMKVVDAKEEGDPVSVVISSFEYVRSRLIRIGRMFPGLLL